jgi:hypothetical protein
MGDRQTVQVLMYLAPKQELVRELGSMILYSFLHFQGLWNMERTSRRDGTAGDVRRTTSTGVYTGQGWMAM